MNLMLYLYIRVTAYWNEVCIVCFVFIALKQS